MEAGLQPAPAAQLVGLSDAGGVRHLGGEGLWKRRGLRPPGKRCAFPTFPQPRRPLFRQRICYAVQPAGTRIMTGTRTGGRSGPVPMRVLLARPEQAILAGELAVRLVQCPDLTRSKRKKRTCHRRCSAQIAQTTLCLRKKAPCWRCSCGHCCPATALTLPYSEIPITEQTDSLNCASCHDLC